MVDDAIAGVAATTTLNNPMAATADNLLEMNDITTSSHNNLAQRAQIADAFAAEPAISVFYG
jgi:hypothetical protein